MPGETITDQEPMITFKLPAEVDIASAIIKVFLDGDEITSEIQLNPDYIFFSPLIPLTFGMHNMLVVFQDSEDNDYTSETGTIVPKMAWSFRVARVTAPTPSAAQRAASQRQQPVTTTGKLILKLKTIDTKEFTRALNPASSLRDIKYQEGNEVSSTLDFTHRFYGKTYIGHYDRSTEQITGRTNDNFSLRYLDTDNNDITFGDFYLTSDEFSQLTINGVQMRGIKYKHASRRKYTTTYFYGRSQDAQDGRLKRFSYGAKFDATLSRSHTIKASALKSYEKATCTYGISRCYANPAEDNIFSIRDLYTYSKTLRLDSEAVLARRQKSAGYPARYDSANRTTLTYNPKTFYLQVGHRSVGPYFNPTVLGTYIETDRKGSFGEFRYSNKSKQLSLNSFYDVYHNNLHHQKTDNITDKYYNSRVGATLDYGWILPTLTLSYNKLYIFSDGINRTFGTLQNGENTVASLSASRNLKDIGPLNGTRLTFSATRSDTDRLTNRAQNTARIYTEFGGRADSRSLSFSTRFAAKAQLIYSTSWSKSNNTSRTNATFTYTSSWSNTDSLGLQWNIIPFKLISNYNYRRSTSSTLFTLTNRTTLTSNPLERQHTLNFVYYLSQKRKLMVEFMDYDKDYRVTANRSYREQSVELGYSLDF